MNYRSIVKILFLFIYSANIFAADVSFLDVNNVLCKPRYEGELCFTLYVSGDIEVGDTKRLDASILKLLTEFMALGIDISDVRIGAVAFSSNGGNIQEAMSLGRAIRKREAVTHIYPNDHCYSACVIAFMGGVFRTPIGEVGIHSFHSPEMVGTHDMKNSGISYDRVYQLVSGYLKEMRVTNSLLDEMQKVPHQNLAVLSWEAKKRIGVFGMDPVYAATHNKIDKGSKYILE